MSRFASLLNTYLNKPPPRLGTRNAGDLLTLARLGFDIRRLGRSRMQEFLRLIGMNIRYKQPAGLGIRFTGLPD